MTASKTNLFSLALCAALVPLALSVEDIRPAAAGSDAAVGAHELTAAAQPLSPDAVVIEASARLPDHLAELGVEDAVPAHDYLVYFPADDAALTPQAREALHLIADEIQSYELNRVTLSGGTGRLDTARARTIADALAAAGVPEKWIAATPVAGTQTPTPHARLMN